MSRDGASKTYWGGTGSNRGNNICACGVNEQRTCADPSDKCNCNANDGVWRSDQGFLTWKFDLPVTELRFGDTQADKNEMGYHTLGKLTCSGLQGTVKLIRYSIKTSQYLLLPFNYHFNFLPNITVLNINGY